MLIFLSFPFFSFLFISFLRVQVQCMLFVEFIFLYSLSFSSCHSIFISNLFVLISHNLFILERDKTSLISLVFHLHSTFLSHDSLFPSPLLHARSRLRPHSSSCSCFAHLPRPIEFRSSSFMSSASDCSYPIHYISLCSLPTLSPDNYRSQLQPCHTMMHQNDRMQKFLLNIFFLLCLLS